MLNCLPRHGCRFAEEGTHGDPRQVWTSVMIPPLSLVVYPTQQKKERTDLDQKGVGRYQASPITDIAYGGWVGGPLYILWIYDILQSRRQTDESGDSSSK